MRSYFEILHVAVLIQYRLVTNRQTDGETNGHMTTAYAALAFPTIVDVQSDADGVSLVGEFGVHWFGNYTDRQNQRN